ncbi:MAG TPA: ECF-type sigma factor [Vicinamibacterales bacterium]|nr:ECF-type sigma factor [Vicinamibacterales bacterium]
MDSALSTLVASAEQGDPAAADQLFTALYDELHRMARRELARRGGGVTIGATTLLHEAYLDISDRDRAAFPDRNRFMGYAARVMRGLIIDYARRRQAQKRGGLFEITSIATDVADAVAADAQQLTRLSDALNELESADARLARVVDLKFFCGFSFVEIGGMLGVSERTIQRDWEKARIYLHSVLREDLPVE